MLGVATRHVPAIAAKIGMVVGMASYAFFTFINISAMFQPFLLMVMVIFIGYMDIS